MEVSIVELRRHTRRVIEAVVRGETVTITSRGKAKVRMVPLESERPRIRAREHPAFGIWKDRKDMQDVEAYLEAQRKRRRHAL
jgi:prevent-host-death family protein